MSERPEAKAVPSSLLNAMGLRILLSAIATIPGGRLWLARYRLGAYDIVVTGGDRDIRQMRWSVRSR